MLGLRLNVVEQLIVFMLNILNELLPMVEFDIMWIIFRMVLFIMIVMVKTSMVIFPVSVSLVVAIAMMRYNWLMNCVVRVEMSIVLNAMDVMVNFSMLWMEFVRVRVVIEGTMMGTFNIVMSTMQVIVVHICVNIMMILVDIMMILVDIMMNQ